MVEDREKGTQWRRKREGKRWKLGDIYTTAVEAAAEKSREWNCMMSFPKVIFGGFRVAYLRKGPEVGLNPCSICHIAYLASMRGELSGQLILWAPKTSHCQSIWLSE